MADFDSSLPIRTESDGDVVAKIADGNTPSQKLGIDASGRITANINDISAGTQTNDVKVTLDGEAVVLGAGTAEIGKARITDGVDELLINPDGSINVAIVQALSGGEVHNYNTAAAVAAAGTSNHDYTVTAAKTLKLFQVLFSASGKMKAELRVETGVATNAFNTRAVGFFDGASPNGGTGEFNLKQPIEVAAGVRVRLIRTNRSNQAQDLYSTIIGEEV